MAANAGSESETQAELEGGVPVSIVHVSIPNQPVQVQSVIQTSSGALQAIQVTPVTSEGDSNEEDDGKKRRELLARRPSYRRILNDLSSETPSAVLAVPKIEEDSNSSQTSQESQEANESSPNDLVQYPSSSIVKVVPAQTIHIAANDGVSTQGLQTLTMSNVSTTTSTPSGATIVQYAQSPDGQFFIPVSSIAAGSVQAYQISNASTLPQGVVMATTGGAISSPTVITEEVSRKRELRLLKNSGRPIEYLEYGSPLTVQQPDVLASKRELRLLKNKEAARECRRKKKEYVKCLENRVAVLENQNKALIEELKSLKELYCQKDG